MIRIRTVTEVSAELIDTIVSATLRWAHRKDGGHSRRTIGAGIKRARRAFVRMGFTEPQIRQMLQDCRDMAQLEMAAECDE